MKTPLDNDLNEAYEAFNQDHDRLRYSLMTSLPHHSKLHKQISRTTYFLQLVRNTVLRNGATKIATAAVIVIATCLGTVLLDNSASSAYAIVQTIKALEKVTTVHVIGTDWDGNRYEVWNKINPETGKSEWVCIDQTPHGYKIASRPDGSCVWDENGKVVRYSNKPIASNDFRYSQVFEQIAEKMVELNENEKITIRTEKDSVYDKPLVVIHVVTSIQDYKIYVDAESKLPVRLYFDKADNMQQIAKTIDEIYYNEPLPEGLFDFEVPAEWYSDWSMLDDPMNGLAIGGLTHEQGAIKTAREYWQAVIDNNWDLVQKIRPLATGDNLEQLKILYEENKPQELSNISGMNHLNDPGTFAEVTCLVKTKNGATKKSVLNVELKQTPHGRIGVIADSIGDELADSD